MIGYFDKSRQLGISLVLVAPVLLIYEVGLLVVGTGALNGADFVTQQVLRLGGFGFLVFNLGILAAYGGGLYASRKQGVNPSAFFVPLLVESAIYAFLMGTLILQVMQGVHLLGPEPLGSRGLVTRLVLSAGAGIHEELTFRLVLMGGIAWTLRKVFGPDAKVLPLTVALVASSVLFSLAHFSAEPFGWFPFWFRTFAGAFFGGLFLIRGFAVTVYTHALYDVYVLVIRG